MHIGVNHRHILQSNRATESKLVDAGCEVGVEEAAVIDGKADRSTDELKIVEMLGVDVRVRIEL